MTDEDAFLRAIHTAPGDHLPKLVYADWLDEQGQSEKAKYIRNSVTGKKTHDTWTRWDTPHEEIGKAWFDLYTGATHLWNAPTLLALGRLQGLLDGLAAGNDHRSDIHFHFTSELVPFDGTLQAVLARWYQPPVPTLTPIEDWRASLRVELVRWIGMAQGTVTRRAVVQRAHQTAEGCGWTADRVLQLVTEVLPVDRGWQVDPTATERWGIEYTHFLLVGGMRALRLTFEFDD